jgi:ribbon-helix-helix CopG family protein
MMYVVYIMKRTQIYLSDEQGRLLAALSRTSGQTISELIRAAIDRSYAGNRGLNRETRLRLARAAAGAWRDFPESGAEYVDRIRGRRRLSRLHGER